MADQILRISEGTLASRACVLTMSGLVVTEDMVANCAVSNDYSSKQGRAYLKPALVSNVHPQPDSVHLCPSPPLCSDLLLCRWKPCFDETVTVGLSGALTYPPISRCSESAHGLSIVPCIPSPARLAPSIDWSRKPNELLLNSEPSLSKQSITTCEQLLCRDDTVT